MWLFPLAIGYNIQTVNALKIELIKRAIWICLFHEYSFAKANFLSVYETGAMTGDEC